MNGDENERLFREAISLRDVGDFQGSLDTLNSIAECLNYSPAFHIVRGDVYCELRDFDSAIDCFRTATKLAPANELASLSLFNCLWELGKQGDNEAESQALKEIRRFLSLSDSSDYRKIIAELHEKRELIWPKEEDD